MVLYSNVEIRYREFTYHRFLDLNIKLPINFGYKIVLDHFQLNHWVRSNNKERSPRSTNFVSWSQEISETKRVEMPSPRPWWRGGGGASLPSPPSDWSSGAGTVSGLGASRPDLASRQSADTDKCFPMTEELQNPLTLVGCWHVVSDSSC